MQKKNIFSNFRGGRRVLPPGSAPVMVKRINNDLQNTTQKSKYRATQTLLKPGVNLGAPEG